MQYAGEVDMVPHYLPKFFEVSCKERFDEAIATGGVSMAVSFQLKVISKVSFFATLLAIHSSSAQSRNELSKRYPALNVYRIRAHVLMTARFDSHNLVCESEISPEGESTLPLALAAELENELVPLPDRGKEDRFFDPSSSVAGGVAHLQRNFANVSIAETSFFSESSSEGIAKIQIVWRKRVCT